MSPDLPWTVSVSFCCLCHRTGVSKLLIWATRLGPQIHFGRSAASQNKHCSGCERGHGRSALAKGPRRNLTFKMSIRSKALGSQSSLGCQSSSRNGDPRCLQDAAACWGPPRDVEYLKYAGLGGLPPTHPLLCSVWDLFIPLFPPLSRPPQKSTFTNSSHLQRHRKRRIN